MFCILICDGDSSPEQKESGQLKQVLKLLFRGSSHGLSVDALK